MEASVSSKAMGKREAILAKRRNSSLEAMGPRRRMVMAPLMTWQFAPEVVEVQVSDKKRQVQL